MKDDTLSKLLEREYAAISVENIANSRRLIQFLPRTPVRTEEQKAADAEQWRLARVLLDLAYEWDVYDLLHDDCGDW